MTQQGGPVSPNDLPVANWASMGLSETQQAQQFYSEEWMGAMARGQGNPFNGWRLPAADAGDFWAVYSMAEQFAANTGWRYLATPQTVLQMIGQGMQSWDQLDVFNWLSNKFNLGNTMPWAGMGVTQTQYNQQNRSLQQMFLELTGKDNWKAAGISQAMASQALRYGWTQQQLIDHMMQDPHLASQYGYVKAGYTYNSFQTWKGQNSDTLRQRYGNHYTHQNAVQELLKPLTAFHAQGSAFGQEAPYVAAQAAPAMGRQSSVR